MPDEGALVEQLAVLGEVIVPQPFFQARFAGAFRAGIANQIALIVAAKGGGEQGAEALGCGLLAVEGRQAYDAIVIRQLFQAIRAERRAIGKSGTGLARPLVADQPCHGDMEGVIGALEVPVE